MAADVCWQIVFFLLGLAWLRGTWHGCQLQGRPAAVQALARHLLRPQPWTIIQPVTNSLPRSGTPIRCGG